MKKNFISSIKKSMPKKLFLAIVLTLFLILVGTVIYSFIYKKPVQAYNYKSIYKTCNSNSSICVEISACKSYYPKTAYGPLYKVRFRTKRSGTYYNQVYSVTYNWNIGKSGNKTFTRNDWSTTLQYIDIWTTTTSNNLGSGYFKITPIAKYKITTRKSGNPTRNVSSITNC